MTSLRLLLAVVVLVTAGCSSDDRVVASCGRAKLTVGVTAPEAASALSQGATVPAVAVPRGETLFAAGQRLDDDCNAGTSGDGAPSRVRLFVVQGDQRVSVAQVSPSGSDASFSVSFGVPATLTPGVASVVAQTSLEPDETPIATADLSIE